MKKLCFCFLLLLFLSGCASRGEKVPLTDDEEAEEIMELLLESNERDRYYNAGFPFGERMPELEAEGYITVSPEVFRGVEEVKDYFYAVYTEELCEKWLMFSGETPRWKIIDGILCQSMADGIYQIITEAYLEESMIYHLGKNKRIVEIPFVSDIDNSVYYVEYTLVRTEEGFRIDGRRELIE